MYMCPIPKGFRERATSLYSTLYKRTTCHVLTRVANALMLMVEFSKMYYTM
jgi:hypothetical protein